MLLLLPQLLSVLRFIKFNTQSQLLSSTRRRGLRQFHNNNIISLSNQLLNEAEDRMSYNFVGFVYTEFSSILGNVEVARTPRRLTETRPVIEAK